LICDDGELERAAQCGGPDGNILRTCRNGQLFQEECDSERDCERSDGFECDD
jgi:hypothetical protein